MNVLYEIGFRSKTYNAKLTKDTGYSPHTVMSVVADLKRRRWVIESKHPDNKRVRMLMLSQEGMLIRERMIPFLLSLPESDRIPRRKRYNYKI